MLGGIQSIPWATAWRVALCSSPTLIGIGAYTWAATKGSIFIAGGVLSSMMVGTAVIAWILYQERLRTAQWVTIAAIYGCLLVLGFLQ